MEIITAGKIIQLILCYCAISQFIAYRDRPMNVRAERLTVESGSPFGLGQDIVPRPGNHIVQE